MIQNSGIHALVVEEYTLELELHIIWRGSIRTSIISTTRSHTISTSSIELGTRTAETPD